MNRSLINQCRPFSGIRAAQAGWLSVVLLLAGCGASHESKSHDAHTGYPAGSPVPNQTPRIPAHFDNVAQARPLPAVLDPRQFSDPVIVKAYGYAQANPEVFAQQPCYCYCDAGAEKHRSLLDCYASTHSVECALCLKEGLLVHKLLAEGKNAGQIREEIVRGEWKNVKLE